MEKLIRDILNQYPMTIKSFEIEKELNTQSWHNDKHFKILVNHNAYSARLIGQKRSMNDFFGELTDEIIEEQIIFTEYLIKNSIPFMEIVKSRKNERFLSVLIDNKIYRFILFKWINGVHFTKFNDLIVEEMGSKSATFHLIASKFESDLFPKKSHLIAYDGFVNILLDKLNDGKVSLENKSFLKEYLELTKMHICNARTEQFEFIIQSDLNPLNILWNEDLTLKGIIDFESITYGDRIEGLAWLIKWYARTNDLNAMEVSKSLADKFLTKYNNVFQIDNQQLGRLASLVWLSGCINWKFLNTTSKLLNLNDARLKNHLDFYLMRGKCLKSLIT
ncbi:phosphotransferase [Gottfriedia luciferensis]|uniref:phosphotransferase n=1 Tax=Gottfriedia luciferensis TaxID=178774 RepID=UPI000B447EED|nr:phosphotransferase [Gottfriedia luciferensis]